MAHCFRKKIIIELWGRINRTLSSTIQHSDILLPISSLDRSRRNPGNPHNSYPGGQPSDAARDVRVQQHHGGRWHRAPTSRFQHQQHLPSLSPVERDRARRCLAFKALFLHAHTHTHVLPHGIRTKRLS